MNASRALTVITIAFLLLAAAASAPLAAGDGEPAADGVNVVLRNSAGSPVGVVKLTQEDGHVLVRAIVHDLPSGFHGFHVHQTGVCTPPFTSAGGHFNPGGTGHSGHAGDLPVLLVNADGTGELRLKTDRFTLADLADADGSAVIVHANADNYANVPSRYHSHATDIFGPDTATLATGDAGARIACGAIELRGDPR
jgi:Cu-Zn family superoxide dismutase